MAPRSLFKRASSAAEENNDLEVPLEDQDADPKIEAAAGADDLSGGDKFGMEDETTVAVEKDTVE